MELYIKSTLTEYHTRSSQTIITHDQSRAETVSRRQPKVNTTRGWYAWRVARALTSPIRRRASRISPRRAPHLAARRATRPASIEPRRAHAHRRRRARVSGCLNWLREQIFRRSRLSATRRVGASICCFFPCEGNGPARCRCRGGARVSVDHEPASAHPGVRCPVRCVPTCRPPDGLADGSAAPSSRTLPYSSLMPLLYASPGRSSP